MSRRLEFTAPGDAVVFRRIFSHRKPFYDTSSLVFIESMAKDFDQDNVKNGILFQNKELYAAPHMEPKSQSYCYNVNCFGQLSGFDKILKVFAISETKASELKFAKRLTKSVANMADFMDKDHWAALCIPTGKAGLAYLSKISESELRQIKPTDMSRFTRQLSRLFKGPFDHGKPTTITPVEEVELGIALRLCIFPSLERRLTGIGILMGKLGRLSHKWPSISTKEPNAEALSFAEWLRANKFANILFGESIREELLKRAGDLLVFMYAWGMLPGQEIVDLWDYAIKRHDSIQTSILQLIELLTIHLSQKDAFLLFGKVRQLPLSELRENMLGVLNALAKNEYYRNKRKEKRKAKNTQEEHKLRGGTIEGIGKFQRKSINGESGSTMHEETKVNYELRNYFAASPPTVGGANLLGHKRARDDSSQVCPERRHARTGSGDQGRVAFKPRPEFETEPFIPEDDPEGPIMEPCDVLNYIWSLTNEGAVREGLPLVVQTQLIDLFLTLLNRFYRNKCADYLHISEGMLASDNSFGQCSKIYMKIVETLAQDSQWKLQTTIEDFLQKIVINLIKFKRVATQKGIEILAAERAEEEECMDTQSSIEEKNAREGEQFPVGQAQPMVEDFKETETLIAEDVAKEEEKEAVVERSEEKLERVGQLEDLPVLDVLEEAKAEVEEPAEDRDIYLTLITNEYLKLTYYQELEQRLELLKFLVTKGKLPLKPESIPLLWQTLLINSFSKKEIDTFFEFMHAVIRSENGLTLVASHVFDAFFFEILLKMDQRDYPLHAFSCLKEMIIALNISYKHISVTPSGSFEITDIRLIGFEAVWEIALQARDSAVQKAATDFLHEVYKRLSPELSKKQGTTIREEFLLKCMAGIKSGVECLDRESTNSDYIARVGRSLELLSGYIAEFETAPVEKKRKFIPNYEYEINISNNGGTRIKLKVNSMMKMQELCEKIKQHFKYTQDVKKLLFITQGRRIEPSDTTIYENGIKEGMTVGVSLPYIEDTDQVGMAGTGSQKQEELSEIQLQSEIMTLQSIFPDFSKDILTAALRKARGNTDQAAEYLFDDFTVNELQEEAKAIENARLIQSVNTKSSNLSEIIANNNKYFAVLYQLLSGVNPELTEKAWSLIQKIPINTKMMDDILAIKTMEIVTPWEQIYALETPYKFAYHLRIIRHILRNAPEDSRYEWITCFVMLEGLYELCNAVGQFEGLMEKLGQGLCIKTLMQCIELSFMIIRELLEGSLIGLQQESYKSYAELQNKPAPGGNMQDGVCSSSAAPLGKVNCSVGPDTNSPAKTEAAKDGDNTCIPLVLKDEVARMVVGIVEREELLGQVIKVLRAVNQDSIEKESEKVLSEGMETLIAILLSDMKTGFSKLYADDRYKEYLHQSLVKSANENNKSSIIKGLSILFKVYYKVAQKEWGILPPDVVHLDIFAKMLPDPSKTLQNTETYFGFLAGLAEIYAGPNAELATTQIGELIGLLLDAIKKKLQSEVSETQEDKQLAGYLKLLTKLIEVREDSFLILTKKLDFDLVNMLCWEIFGTDPSGTKPKVRRCATKGTMRSTVFLLLALCKKSSSYSSQLLPHLVKFHEAQLKCALKDIGVDVGNKTPGSYVGLKNFGCTCYINSLLQQLYMMPEVRYNLLGLDQDKISQLGPDRVTANLQKIFATLQMSKQQYYPPGDFCKDFKESDGKPINVCVQQDVDEFFNRLAEKLEAELKALNADRLLKETMEVVLLQEISSLENDISYTSQKEDPCLALPLDIKGRKSIEEALDFFVKEEILEGDNKYHCEEYNRLIRASKKCVLKKLPHTLVLNLKRFEFNYATMQKQKLNDYCEFPFDLNLYKWTYDGLKNVNADLQKDYQYHLVGVLVHSGTAEGGHYYSYIKEREPKSPNYGKWFEFNDTRVQPFDPKDLKREAFGTLRKPGQISYGGDANAYLLVYQKAEDVHVENKGANEKFATLIEQESEALTNTRIYLDAEYMRFVKEYFGTFVPERIEKFNPIDSDTYEIKKNRQQTQNTLEREKKEVPEIVDEDEIMWSAASPGFTMAKLVVLYANDLIAKTKDTATFKEWSGLLMPHISQNSLFALWLIKYMTKHKATLFELLIECNSSETRSLFKDALGEALKVVAKVEEPYMREVEKFLCSANTPDSKIEKSVSRAASVRFVNLLLNDGLSYARANYRKFDEFFSMLITFASLGPIEVGSMIREGAIYLTIDFVANTPTPLRPVNLGALRPTMGEFLKEANFRHPIQLLSILVRSCSTSRMRLLETFPKYAQFYALSEAPAMPESETEFLFSAKWSYPSLVYHDKEDMISILVHLTWEDETKVKEVVSSLTKYVFDKKIGMNHQVPLEVLKEVVTVKDSYLKQRYFTFAYTDILARNNVYEYLEYYRDLQETFVLDILEFIAEMSAIEKIAEMIREDKDRLKWTPEWLEKLIKANNSFIGAGASNKDTAAYADTQKKAAFVLRHFAEQLGLRPLPKEIPLEANQPANNDSNKKEPMEVPNGYVTETQKLNDTKKVSGEADTQTNNN